MFLFRFGIVVVIIEMMSTVVKIGWSWLWLLLIKTCWCISAFRITLSLYASSKIMRLGLVVA